MCLSGSSLDTLKSKVACQHLSRSKIIKEHGKSDDKKCEKLWIIVKLILHIKCVLNYAKVYVKHNIYHKKSKYMIFHVLLRPINPSKNAYWCGSCVAPDSEKCSWILEGKKVWLYLKRPAEKYVHYVSPRHWFQDK